MSQIPAKINPAGCRSVNNFEHLQTAVMQLSLAEEWHHAKLEWELNDIAFAKEPETCACTYTPIHELCMLVNRQTRHCLVVGNHCVTHFLDLAADKLFAAIKRIRDNPTSAPTELLTTFMVNRGIITKWEYDFTIGTLPKRKITFKQLAKRTQINRKILGHYRLLHIPRRTAPSGTASSASRDLHLIIRGPQ